MKEALFKPPIPPEHSLVVKELLDPYFDPNWHFHSEYQLFVVLKGQGTRFVGDNISPFGPGDMVLTGPNLPHLWRCDEPYFAHEQAEATQGIVVYFQEQMLGESFLERQEARSLRDLLQLSRRGIAISGPSHPTLMQLIDQMRKAEGFRQVLLLLEMLHLLSEDKSIRPIASLGYVPVLRPADTERLNRVHTYLFQHFKSPIALEEVASIANMSPSAFSRYFKQRTHKKFSQFVSELRVGHACKLLLEEQAKVVEVAYACGFPTLSNFNKQFRSITGKSPREYRQAYASWIG
jgi:AraC-like DNA-binding protein